MSARRYTPEQLAEILEAHRKWLGDEPGGKRADLRDADLRGADLSGADLYGADLSDADLSDASLRDADLSGASLAPIRDDLRAVLDAAPAEVPALLTALRAGKVNGSTYEGECACLVGTIARARGVHYCELGALKPDSERPAERFFLAISEGDTPANNQAAALAEQWITEWQAERSPSPTEVA